MRNIPGRRASFERERGGLADLVKVAVLVAQLTRDVNAGIHHWSPTPVIVRTTRR